MASAEETAATIRRGYEYFNSGNMDALAGIFNDDAVWHVGGRNHLSGEKRGRDACFAYFGEIAQVTEGNFQAEMHDVIAGEAHAVGIQTSKGTRGDKTLDVHCILLFHLRDGKIAEGWEHYEDSRAWDEFWS